MVAATRCIDLKDLSNFLGFAPQHLFYLVSEADNLYFDIEIPKRSDPTQMRSISIPATELKGVQKAILQNILEDVKPHNSAYAYVRGKSVVSAASKLCGKTKSVLKVDLCNFFPSISERRVFGLFRSLGFNDTTTFILTKLTTYQGKLCQGSPTSPYISNLVCRRLDEQLTALSNVWDMQYLRYSDDIFFYKGGNFNFRNFMAVASNIIQEHSFEVNRRKTRYLPKDKPRFTLGLATHGKRPQIPRKVRQNYRAAFYKASTNLTWAKLELSKLSGMAEWYKCVYGADDTYLEYCKIIRNVKSLKLHETYIVK